MILYNFIFLMVRKLRYGSRYQSSFIERLSPASSIRLIGKSKIKLGYNIDIAPHTRIEALHGGDIFIGDRTYINRDCIISCHKSVHIGKNCMFGPGVRIYDNNHKFSKDEGVSSKLKTGSISIGDNCWIASNAIILKGADIGNNCIIGVGCIIDYKIPDGSLVRLKQQHSVEQLR